MTTLLPTTFLRILAIQLVCFIVLMSVAVRPDARLLKPSPHCGVDKFDSTYQTIHVFVALCDNLNQGIVKVPAKIGNGQNPSTNLYWGAGYGVKTFFSKSSDWKLIRSEIYSGKILERLVFKHATKKVVLVADAYDGKYIDQTIYDFILASAGNLKDTIHLNKKTIGIRGNANLLAYIGHDGLMEFEVPNNAVNTDNKNRSVIALACISQKYFDKYLHKPRIKPLVLTTGLMCPEAYTLHDALKAYVVNLPSDSVRMYAVRSYAKYQKCSQAFAQKLLVNTWMP